MEKKLCYIYKLTSPTDRIYIGKSSNLNERIKNYKYLKCKGQPIIYNSLMKYGFSAHTFDIIYEGENTLEEINELEIYFIGLFNSFHGNNENGMNLTLGGDGGFGVVFSDERKKKIIEANKRRNYKKHTEETKELMSESRKKTGITPAIQKAIEDSKGRKIKKTNEWIKNNSESIKKPIIQFDLDGYFIKEWASAKDVEETIGLSRKNISANLRNKTKHAFKYVWKYKQ